MPSIVPADAPDEVVDAVVGRVAELERTQRAEDVDDFLALFDPNAVWVTGGGRRLIGLDVIGEFTRSVLPGAFTDGGSVDYEVEHVLIVADDVVLTGVRQQYRDSSGAVTAVGLPSYVWRRMGGEWSIVVGQNTTVPEPTTA
jgi:uncharacterized protein (TIGR02246 family)